MRKVIDDPRLMVRVCDLYYNQGISQQQIAKDLNLSRPTVSRVLALAKEQGIVKISISNVNAVEHWELERRIWSSGSNHCRREFLRGWDEGVAWRSGRQIFGIYD